MVVAFISDWLWKDHEKTIENDRKVKEKKRREEYDIAKVSNFLALGCDFYGFRNGIWRFAHKYDLIRSVVVKEFDSFGENQFRIIDTNEGFVLAYCQRGWPDSLSERDAHDVLKIISDGRFPKNYRPIIHNETSDVALAYDEKMRLDHLETIRQRVIKRTVDFKARSSSDMGPDAIAVYVITTRTRNASKVGISDNPDRRKTDLQTGSSEQLNVHARFWMKNRTEALLLERRCHKLMAHKGHVRIGEWFSVEPEIASRHVTDTYLELVEQRAIVESHITASESSTDEELRKEVLDQVRWRHSKKGNLVTELFGRKITVYKNSKGWRWVCEGIFSEKSFDSVESAQSAALSFVQPSRDQMLNLLLGLKPS